jgi:hypothetical protein
MKKTPMPSGHDESPIVREARILDSHRATALSLAASEAKWLRRRVADLYDDMSDPQSIHHASAIEVAGHVARLDMHLEQLKERNAAMRRLRLLAEALDVTDQWPKEVELLVVLRSEKK